MRPKKILLAEDDGDDQQFFFDFLRGRKDLELLPAVENGEELLEFLDKIKDDHALPDAIILDQNMPKCNGLQTLELLKKHSQYASIPVMVYSTFADDHLLEKSTASGALLIKPKPATAEGYNQMMDDLLDAI